MIPHFKTRCTPLEYGCSPRVLAHVELTEKAFRHWRLLLGNRTPGEDP